MREMLLPALLSLLTLLQAASLREQIELVNSIIGSNRSSLLCPYVCRCTATDVLSLYVTGASGTLPENLGTLSRLEMLQVSETYLTGSIPSGLCSLTNLSHLAISGSGLRGSIPSCVWRFPRLITVFLSRNVLSGTVSFGTLSPSIVVIDLTGNVLTGVLPSTAGTSLRRLSLGMNAFSGTIPAGFLRGQHLQSVDASKNRLTGAIPPPVAPLDELHSLDLSTNHLSGSVPYMGVALKTYLNLEYNSYTEALVDARYSGVRIRAEGNRLNASQCSFSSAFSCGNAQDIDECALLRYDCPVNSFCSDGWSPRMSYTCKCFSGYGMTGDVCLDVNECLSGNACRPGACVNTVGSYYCCPDFQYNPDPYATHQGGERVCRSCYTEFLYVPNPHPKKHLKNLSSYVKCFGECSDGIAYRARYPKSDACIPEVSQAEKCEYPCVGIDTTGLPARAIVGALEEELSRGQYLGELLKTTSPSMVVQHNGSSSSLTLACTVNCSEALELAMMILFSGAAPFADRGISFAQLAGEVVVMVADKRSVRVELIVLGVLGGLLTAGALIFAAMHGRELSSLPAAVAASIRPPLLMRLLWHYRGSSAAGYYYSDHHSSLPIDFSYYGKRGDSYLIKRVYNPTLVSNFLGAYNLQKERISRSDLFSRTTWREDPTKRKEEVYNRYTEVVRSYSWWDPKGPVIIVGCHGTGFRTAESICETGFASLSKNDEGWYGKGIYFTSCPAYCLPYMFSRQRPSIVLSYVIPGNVFPVTEDRNGKASLCGSALQQGYSCHYVCVTQGGEVVEDLSECPCDEIVVPQESQILPMYIIEVREEGLSRLLERSTFSPSTMSLE